MMALPCYASRMRALAGLLAVFAACTFDTAVDSEFTSTEEGVPADAQVATEDSGVADASLIDAAIDASPIDAAVDAAEPPILYLLQPTGEATIKADIGGNGGGAFDEDCPDGRVVTGFDGDDNSGGICRLQAFCSVLTANPDGTVTTSDPQLTDIHGSENSVVQEDPIVCPANQVVVGVHGRSNNRLRKLEIICAPLTWDYATTTYSIGTSANVQGNIGREQGQQSTDSCDTDEVVGGFGGRAGTLVDRFELHCFPLEAIAQ